MAFEYKFRRKHWCSVCSAFLYVSEALHLSLLSSYFYGEIHFSLTFLVFPPRCCLSVFTVDQGDGGKHRALLIGINYKGCGAGELKGCHNDVAQMREYITTHVRGAAVDEL